jgi:hypothetical protein
MIFKNIRRHMLEIELERKHLLTIVQRAYREIAM